MKPYYEDKACTIYHGDCREILPTLEPVDLVLTDPPYGIGEANAKNKSRSRLGIAKDYGADSWDDERIENALMELVISAGHSAVVFGGNYYTHILPQNTCWLVWDKVNGGNDFADCEMAWTNLPGAVRKITYMWHGMLRKVPEDRHHPTQKPLHVMTWCIGQADKKTGKAQSLIIDPFMGSGSTLRAAKDLGRKSIGIELEEKYCEIAAKRLQQEVLDFSEARQ